jgi:hypothetical protein
MAARKEIHRETHRSIGTMYGRAYGKAKYGGGVGYLLPGRQEAAGLALRHFGTDPKSMEAREFVQGFIQEVERLQYKWANK